MGLKGKTYASLITKKNTSIPGLFKKKSKSKKKKKRRLKK